MAFIDTTPYIHSDARCFNLTQGRFQVGFSGMILCLETIVSFENGEDQRGSTVHRDPMPDVLGRGVRRRVQTGEGSVVGANVLIGV